MYVGQDHVMASRDQADAGNGQRAFWMFLLFLLVGPFFGGLAGAVLFAVGGLIGIAPEPFYGKSFTEVAPHITPIGITAFVWSAIPSAFTAIALVPLVLKTGTVGFLMTAAIGVIAFTAAILIVPFPTGGVQPLLAFVAGCIAVASRQVLLQGGILKPDLAAT